MPQERKRLLAEIRARPVTFVPGKKSLSRLSGDWSSPFPGKGFEPMGYRDFELGDDPRRINLAATARRNQPTVVDRIALSEFRILVVVDASESMRVRRKYEIQLAAALLMIYSAWKAETTFGVAIQAGTELVSLGTGVGSRHLDKLQRSLWLSMSASGGELPRGKRQSLARCLPSNSMMLYCSDFLDVQGNASDLGHLSHAMRRYDFIPVVIQDELECSFPPLAEGTVVPLRNPESGAERDTFLSPDIAVAIRDAHERRFRELIQCFRERDAPAIHLDSPEIRSMSSRIDAYFRRRIGA